VSIIVVGCSHSRAPTAVLESLATPASGYGAVLARLKAVVREALLLSTCNRTEIYALVGHSASGAELVAQVLAERAGTRADHVRPHLYVHADANAVCHALRVASGMDSMVLGEDQIQAQWKRALDHARVAETLGPVLDRLGAAALSCGKRVRTFTGIGRHAVSLESLAIRAALARLGTLDGREAIVIGTGESAALIARQLRASYETRVTVVSRSPDKAVEFANEIGATAAPVEALPRVLARADAVFCCTSAPHALISAAHLTERAATRPAAPMVCVDLGMPHDVDRSVADIPGVSVVALDELGALAQAHREERRQHLPQAEAIVRAEVERFLGWQTGRGSAATIARLQKHAEAVVEGELTKAGARLAAMSPADRELVTGLLRRSIKKLLHAPSEALKQHPEAENIALALEFAFGLSRGTLEERLPAAPAVSAAPHHPEEAAS
jgi:glutamyl-tRNA reductase